MKRLLLLCVLTATVAAPVARAAAQDQSGQVLVPTFGSPALARLAYVTSGQNGVTGWVFAVRGGSRFELSTVQRPSGIEDFDLFFYASITEATVPPLATHASPGDEAGSVPAGARWAVVTLSAGAAGVFRYIAS